MQAPRNYDRVGQWWGADLQVNGGRLSEMVDGVEYLDYTKNGPGTRQAGITVSQCCAHATRLRSLGTRVYFPTLVTGDRDRALIPNLRVLADFMETTAEGKHVPGFHAEANYLQNLKGYRGAHDADLMEQPPVNPALYHRLQEAARGHIRIWTLAVVPGIESVIQAAVADGVYVQLAHFGPANPFDTREIAALRYAIQRCVDAGAMGSTHLGNGTTPESHRHGAHILSQLVHPRLMPTIIVDGPHLPEDFIRTVLAVKRAILVSDAAQYEGAEVGTYQSWAGKVEIAPFGDTFMISPAGNPGILAASWSTLAACVRHMIRLAKRWNFDVSEFRELSLEDISDMSCDLPLKRLGLSPEQFDDLPGATINLRQVLEEV